MKEYIRFDRQLHVKGDIKPSYQMNNKEEETSAISNKDINTMHKTMVIMNT